MLSVVSGPLSVVIKEVRGVLGPAWANWFFGRFGVGAGEAGLVVLELSWVGAFLVLFFMPRMHGGDYALAITPPLQPPKSV
jgi:hypothetical protein